VDTTTAEQMEAARARVDAMSLDEPEGLMRRDSDLSTAEKEGVAEMKPKVKA
jgi:hypothetical protein